MHRTTTFVLSLLALALPLRGASAQEPYTPMVPGGSVRLQVSPIFSTWSSRFDADGDEVPLGADFTADGVGSTVLPALAGFEQAVADASQLPFDLNLGNLASVVEKTQIRIPYGVDVGVTDWLNVGATIPVVQNDVAVAVDFMADPDMINAGLSPGVFDPGVTDGFLGDFQTAIDAFEVNQMAECQADPGSAACLDATALLGDAMGLQGALVTMYDGFSLAPFMGTAAATAVDARLAAIASGFAAAGVAGTPTAAPVATEALTGEEFQAVLTDARFGTAATHPLQRWLTPWALGDIEIRAMLRLLDVGDPGSSFRLTVGGGATYRLGTGSPAQVGNPFDVGTGDGQDDIEVRGWLNTQWTRRLGVWADLRYGIQQSATTVRRVFDPGVPLPPADTEATLEWTPGDYQRIELSPWLRIADALTLAPTYRYYRKGEDTFTLTGGATGPDPAVLTLNSEAELQELAVALVYNTTVADSGPRFEFRGRYRMALSGSGGQVPDARSFDATLRLFVGLWGR